MAAYKLNVFMYDDGTFSVIDVFGNTPVPAYDKVRKATKDAAEYIKKVNQ